MDLEPIAREQFVTCHLHEMSHHDRIRKPLGVIKAVGVQFFDRCC